METVASSTQNTPACLAAVFSLKALHVTNIEPPFTQAIPPPNSVELSVALLFSNTLVTTVRLLWCDSAMVSKFSIPHVPAVLSISVLSKMRAVVSLLTQYTMPPLPSVAVLFMNIHFSE